MSKFDCSIHPIRRNHNQNGHVYYDTACVDFKYFLQRSLYKSLDLNITEKQLIELCINQHNINNNKRHKKNINRAYRMLSRKMFDHNTEDAKYIVCLLLKSKYLHINKNIFGQTIINKAKKFNLCEKMSLIEKNCINKVKQLLSSVLNSSDVNNMIILYSYPIFLRSIFDTQIHIKDGFQITPVQNRTILQLGDQQCRICQNQYDEVEEFLDKHDSQKLIY